MPTAQLQAVRVVGELAALEARSVSAWFGERKVLDRVSLCASLVGRCRVVSSSGCVIVEAGPTATIFGSPSDPRTADYVHGRFG
jgi:hypothetical protein